MPDETKNPAAVELGKLGGQKTAERGPEYYAEIQAKRQIRAGGRPKNPVEATHTGDLKLGNAVIPCAVLADGTRVLSRIGFLRAIGRTGKAKGGRKYDEESKVPVFLTASNLKPFISSNLLEESEPIPFRIKTDKGLYAEAMGYRATLLSEVCNVFIDAKDAGALRPNQLHIADACKLLSRGFQVVGITGLVDEATGYQEVRDRKALEAILDSYLRKEFAAWSKRFPDEFYKEIFRLRGWEWKGMKVNRPQVVGHYTNDLVWDRIAPGLRKALEVKNPKNERGQRRFRNPQWLTEDIGDPALAQHLYALMGLQRACPDRGWKQFHDMVQRAFPKKGETMPFTFTEGEPVA